MKDFQTKRSVRFARVSTASLSPLSLMVLSACGGSSTSSSSSSSASSSYTSLTGSVIDGPLQYATVFYDNNDDGVWDSDEPTTLTDADGSYSLTPNSDSYTVVVTTDDNTVDTVSGAVVSGLKLSAASGASVVSPMTTMMVEGGLTAAQVLTSLGISDTSIDVNNYNPFDTTATGYDADVALEAAQASASISSTLLSFASAAENSGMSSAAAFDAALSAMTAVVQTNAAAGTATDFTSTTGDLATMAAAIKTTVATAAVSDT